MRLPASLGARLFRTQAFRIVLVYVFLFALSVTAIIGFTYWNTRRALDAQTDQTIEAEITGLAEQYQRLGVVGLTEVIVSRSLHGGQGIYLLTDPNNRLLAGNLDGWPQAQHVEGFIEFEYERRIDNKLERRQARGKAFILAGGFTLLVAQDVQERYLTDRFFTTTLPWTVGLMLVFGLVGGAFFSRNLIARLDSINRTSAEIMAGDFSRRVPVSGANDEFDALALNLNRMLERIERLMKGVREVSDSVAHDLRTPLNRLRNRLETALKQFDGNGDVGEIEAAIAETDRLITTFNAILLIAEADAGVARGAMSLIDLSAVAEDVGELYLPVAEESGVTLEIAPSGATMIEGNRSLISQALANLVDNAIKYTPANGHITVTAGDTAQGVELAVADTGPGIPPSERAHVLERFVRLEASRHSPGTGLGLSLVAAVARFHGAELKLEDNRPGLKAKLEFPRPKILPRAARALPAPA
jgi:signal transduction histidine kinase